MIIEILGLQAIDANVPNNQNDILSALVSFWTQNQQGSSSSNNPSKNQETFSFPTQNNNSNFNNWWNSSLPFNFSGKSSQTPLKLSSTASPSQQTVRFDSLPILLQQTYCSLITSVINPKTTPQEIDTMIAKIPPPYQETFLFIVNNQDQTLLHYYCGADQPSPALFSYLIKKLQPIDAMNRPDSQNITPLNLLFTHKRFDLILEFIQSLNPTSNDEAKLITNICNTCFNVFQQNDEYLNVFNSNLTNIINNQFLNSQKGKLSKDELALLKNIFSTLDAENHDLIPNFLSSDQNNASFFALAIQQGKIDLANLFISYIHQFNEDDLNSIFQELNQYIINKSENSKFQLTANDPLFQMIDFIMKKCEPEIFISAFRNLIENQLLSSETKNISDNQLTFLKYILSNFKQPSRNTQDNDDIETLLASDSDDVSLLALAIKQEKINLANLFLPYRSHLEAIEVENVLEELNQYIIKKANNNEKIKKESNTHKTQNIINTSLLKLIEAIIQNCKSSTNFPSSFMHTLVQYASVQQLEQILPLFPSNMVQMLLFESKDKKTTPFEIVAFEQQDVAKLKILLDFIDDPQQCFEIRNQDGEHFLQILANHDRNLTKLKSMFNLFSNDLQASAALALNNNQKNMFDIAMDSNATNTLQYLLQITVPEDKLFEWSSSDEYNPWIYSVLFAIKKKRNNKKNNAQQVNISSYLNSLNRNGNSLLHIAAQNLALKNICTLIQNGADVTLKNDDELNPIRILAQQINNEFSDQERRFRNNNNRRNNIENYANFLYEILKQVERQCAKIKNNDEDAFQNFINEQDSESGNTLLHEILQLPLSSNIIKLLKRHNADFTIQNTDGLTPLNIALQSQDEDIIKLLTPPQEDD